MEYKYSQIFKWKSGKPVKTCDGVIPVYGSNGVIGFCNNAKYKNRIIIGRVGAYCGSVTYCSGEFNATDNTLITECDESKIIYKYAYYALRLAKLNDYAGGSAQPLITQAILSHLKCNIPTIEIQDKVADILSAYDVLIENNNKRIKILEQMAENLYKEWFVRFRFPDYQNSEFENGIPKGWNVVKIKKCVKRLAFNRLYKENELEKEGNVIVIDQSANEYLGFHNNEPSHYANYENPIILFGDHTCKCKLMCKDFSLGENVVPFCSSDTNFTDIYFLYYAVHKIITTEEYKRHWGRFITLKILVPPIELQRKYSKLVVWFEKEKEVLFKHNLNLIKQRDMLLPRLMSGKLEVK